ncbi:MAG: hypothetical protein LBU39_01920 [Desulfobulbaceae bacterium]|jgi:hypothetical protein|nr:hypothetical protein [Desulfobulbaceae bacterium]
MRQIQVLVTRGAGDKRGQDISDALITSEAVAIERGRNEVDQSFSDRETVTLTSPFLQWLAPGEMVRMIDEGSRLGKIKSWSMDVSRGQAAGYQAAISLTIEQEMR